MQVQVEVNAPEVADDFTAQFVRDEIINWITGEQGVVALAFYSMGYPDPWPDLKPSTWKQKLAAGYAPLPDQTRTGKLQADAKNPAIEISAGQITFTIPQGQNSYAAAHQYGSMGTQARQYRATLKAIRYRRGSKKIVKEQVKIGQQMPPRPPLPAPSEEWCARFAQELMDNILKLEGF